MRSRWNALWMAVALVGVASNALAQDVIEPEAGEGGETSVEVGDGDGAVASDAGKPISAALLLGYGISLEDGPNAWGLGFGLRGGYNLDQIFLGVRFVYYLGESEDTPLGDASINLWELGIEGGYDVPAGSLTIRPELGLGLANATVDAGFGSNSEAYLYLAPGVSGLIDVSDNMFAGLDARFQMVFADPDMIKAIVLLATFGLRF